MPQRISGTSVMAMLFIHFANIYMHICNSLAFVEYHACRHDRAMPNVDLQGVAELFPKWMLRPRATRSTVTRSSAKSGVKHRIRISFACSVYDPSRVYDPIG